MFVPFHRVVGDLLLYRSAPERSPTHGATGPLVSDQTEDSRGHLRPKDQSPLHFCHSQEYRVSIPSDPMLVTHHNPPGTYSGHCEDTPTLPSTH